MNEFKMYLHAFLILALAGIGLTLLWILWPVIVAVAIVAGIFGLIWVATECFKPKSQ